MGIGRSDWTRGFARVVLVFVCVSLAFEATNILAMGLDQGSEEASSPEDEFQTPSSDPSLGPSFSIPLTADPTSAVPSGAELNPQTNAQDKSKVKVSTPPLITSNVFPYQPNAITAVVAAAVTMAAMSLKETGHIDLNSIMYLLNSSDFYVGLLGSVKGVPFSAGNIQQLVSNGVAAALKKGIEKSPGFLKPLLDNPSAKIFGNVVNGITYTFATGAGFEYFSQFWKYATKNFPEAQTMTGLLKCSMARKKQVMGNLLYYLVIDGNMQKRIFSSVYNHRLLTFEFIATNVAVYVGAQLGFLIAQKFGPASPMLKNVAPVIGSIMGGLAVQMIPDSWKSTMNLKLVDYKIGRQRAFLKRSIERVTDGITNKIYPAKALDYTGYWLDGVDLQSDINRIFRARSMLESLEFEKMIYSTEQKEVFERIRTEHAEIEESLVTLKAQLNTNGHESLEKRLERWTAENRSPEEIQALSSRVILHTDQQSYYEFLLGAAVDRIKEKRTEADGLMAVFAENPEVKYNTADFISDLAIEDR